MALTTCPDCGHEVSTAAPACPHCGRPNGPVVAAPQPQAHAAAAEETLWHGSPSWLLLIGKIIWLVIVAVALPVALHYANAQFALDDQTIRVMRWIIAAIIVWRIVVVAIAYARIRSIMYTVTNQRVIIETGLVEKKVEDIDLRYVDETNFRQRVVERLLGIGSVTIVSSDKVAPQYMLRGIRDPRGLRELIRARAYEVSQRQLFTRST
jgi:PH (Pleckstrin Homology) domain-containing protein